jgi:hypothetical protein
MHVNCFVCILDINYVDTLQGPTHALDRICRWLLDDDANHLT